MNIFLIGGTGKTGVEIIKQGLERGHIITALVRNPNKLKINHPNLKTIKGNILNPESFVMSVNGQDAVMSSVGQKHRVPELVECAQNVITIYEVAIQVNDVKDAEAFYNELRSELLECEEIVDEQEILDEEE